MFIAGFHCSQVVKKCVIIVLNIHATDTKMYKLIRLCNLSTQSIYINMLYCFDQRELFRCDTSLQGHRIFTHKHALRSTKGNIFHYGATVYGSGKRGGESQLVVLPLSPVRTADSCFWRISLHPSKKASTRLSGPISQLAFILGRQWDLK